MFSTSDAAYRLDELRDRLSRAQILTPELASTVVADACTRIAMPSRATKATQISRLIESEAWTEVALALVEIELPQWKPRRLVYEDGAWLCSLSKQWNLPDWLGDSAEAQHQSLPLAILCALIEARQYDEQPSRRTASSVPQCRVESSSLMGNMCCDNFA